MTCLPYSCYANSTMAKAWLFLALLSACTLCEAAALGEACSEDTDCDSAVNCSPDLVCGGLGAACTFASDCVAGCGETDTCGGPGAFCSDNNDCDYDGFSVECGQDSGTCGGRGAAYVLAYPMKRPIPFHVLTLLRFTAAQTEISSAVTRIPVETTAYAEELGPIVTPQAIVSVSPSTTAAVANPAPAEVRTHYAQTTINATLPISAWNVDRTVALAGAEEQRTYFN